MRVLVAEGRPGLVPERSHPGVRSVVPIVPAVAGAVVAVFVVVVVGQRQRSVPVGGPVAAVLVVERIAVAVCIVRQLPQLRPQACPPYRLEDLLLVGPPGDRNLMEARVYFDAIHT